MSFQICEHFLFGLFLSLIHSLLKNQLNSLLFCFSRFYNNKHDPLALLFVLYVFILRWLPLFILRNFSSLIQILICRNPPPPHTRTRAHIRKGLRSPGIDSTSLCSLASRYVKLGCRAGPSGWESIPGLLERFTNTGSALLCGWYQQETIQRRLCIGLLVPPRVTSNSKSAVWRRAQPSPYL